MSYLYNELRSIWNNRRICASFLLLLFVNFIFLIVYVNSDSVDALKYRQTKKDIINNKYGIMDIYIQDTEDETNKALYSEFSKIGEYGEYKDRVVEQAEGFKKISIFQTKFSVNNIKKTEEDYSKLYDLNIWFVGSYGLNRGLKYAGGIITSIILIVILTLESIMRDKRNGLINLYKTTIKGDGRLIIVKFIAIYICVILFYGLAYAMDLIISVLLYGDVNTSAPVQCIPEYMECGYRLSIGGLLALDYIYKLIIFAMLLAMVILINMVADNELMVLVLSIVYAVFSVLISLFGDRTGRIFLYRFFSGKLFDTKTFFQYLNYNMLNHAVSSFILDTGMCIVVMVICILISCNYYEQKEMFYKDIRLFDKLYIKRKNKEYKYSLCFLESDKLWRGYKMIYFMLLLVVIQIYTYSNKQISWSISDYSYKYYMKQIEGDITEDKLEYINKERERFVELERQLNELEADYTTGKVTESSYIYIEEKLANEMSMQDGFDRCQSYVDYILEMNNAYITAGDDNFYKVGFVYNRGYDMLIGKKSYERRIINAIMLYVMAFCIATFIYLQDYRYKINELLSTTKNYKKLIHTKHINTLVILFFTYIIIYIPEFIWTYHYVGMSAGGYNIRSLRGMSNINLDISISEYMILLYLIRYLCMIIITTIFVITAKKTKRVFSAFIGAFMMVIMPLIICYLCLIGC